MTRFEFGQRVPQTRVTVVLLATTVAIGAFVVGNWQPASSAPPDAKAAAERNEAESRDAFLAVYKVLMHPRCLNCHPNGDIPLQGDDSHLHSPLVKRGTDGNGKFAMKCSNCHQEKNAHGPNTPPGNPNWHLPKPEAPLVFEGRTPAELARQLKDPKQNGGKTLEQLFHHIAEDKLVLGGWDPGEGRTLPPLTHEEFTAKFREWLDKGAAIPKED